MFRNGQWVKFEPTIAVGSQVVLGDQLVAVDEEMLVHIAIPRIRVGADGRHVGIFIKGGKFQDGKGGFRVMPDCIAPQRQILGANGEQNLQLIHQGRICTLLLPLTCVANAAALTDREDLPAYRNETSHPDWQPSA